MLKKTFLVITLLNLLSGCYRMPTEDDYSLVPTTNNPDITHESGSGAMPTMDY